MMRQRRPARPLVVGAVLAGGRSRRMAGRDKTALRIGGTTLLDRVLQAAHYACDWLIVVGPPRTTEVGGVTFVMEAAPGGGPVPAVAAAVDQAAGAAVVVVLAADLPLIRGADVERLVQPLVTAGGCDAVAAADEWGRPNPLLAAYRRRSLVSTLAELKGSVAGASAGRLLPAKLSVVDLGIGATVNVNRPADLERARRLVGAGG